MFLLDHSLSLEFQYRSTLEGRKFVCMTLSSSCLLASDIPTYLLERTLPRRWSVQLLSELEPPMQVPTYVVHLRIQLTDLRARLGSFPEILPTSSPHGLLYPVAAFDWSLQDLSLPLPSIILQGLGNTKLKLTEYFCIYPKHCCFSVSAVCHSLIYQGNRVSDT